MAHVQRIRATVAAVKADPNSFDMGAWFCGSTACFAGHAIRVKALEDHALLMLVKFDDDGNAHGYAPLRPSSPTTARCRFGDGPQKHIPDVAADYLELDPGEADRLFHVEEWPTRYEESYYEAAAAGDAMSMASALEARIEHFIATGQ
jgi:hypothetical protein